MQESSTTPKLIESRDCDDCTVCCNVLTIESDGFLKIPNKKCEHLSSTGGCGIYNDRFTACREWYCGWRYLPELDQSWRPDLRGVLVELCYENYPPPFQGKLGYRFTILNKNKAFKGMGFAKLVLALNKKGIPCIMSYADGEGHNPVTAFLNFALHQVMQQNNPNLVRQELLRALNACAAQPKEIVKIVDGQFVTSTTP